MKFIVSILMLFFAGSTVFAAPAVTVDDKQNAVTGQAPDLPAPGNAVQGNRMPINGLDGQNVAIPPELLSAPQYQPQPLRQYLPSPLHSLHPGDTNN